MIMTHVDLIEKLLKYVIMALAGLAWDASLLTWDTRHLQIFDRRPTRQEDEPIAFIMSDCSATLKVVTKYVVVAGGGRVY